MNVLIVAATEFEIGPWLNRNNSHNPLADVLITGVGHDCYCLYPDKEPSEP